MAVLIKRERNNPGQKNLEEWLIKSKSELEGIETAGPGSVAYTADISYIGMMDEDGEWQEIGEAEEAAAEADTTEADTTEADTTEAEGEGT